MRQSSAPVTIAIVLINCLVFIYVHTMLDGVRETQSFLYDFGLNSSEFWIRQKVWQPLTSMFVHTDLLHFAFNMLAVWSVGTPLEMTLNSGRFTFLYFISGFTGSLFLLIFNADSNAAAIGASGAVFGLLGALAIFYPRARLLVFFIPMRAITAAAILAVISVGFYLFQQLTFIAHMAHLGGLVGGLLYSKFALGLEVGRSDLGASSGGIPGASANPAGGTGAANLFDRLRGKAGSPDGADSTPRMTRAARAAREEEILRLMRGISDEPASQDTGRTLSESGSGATPARKDLPGLKESTESEKSPSPSPSTPAPKDEEPAAEQASSGSQSGSTPPGAQSDPAGARENSGMPGPSRRLEYDPKTGRFQIKE